MGLLAYKIKEGTFALRIRHADFNADRIVYRPSQIALVIDVTVSNAVNSDINNKRRPKAGVMARKGEDVKISKY